MRPLWPIERAVLEAAIHEFPHSAEALQVQMQSAQVSNFENTGAGFFSTLSVTADAPVISEKSPLDVAAGIVAGIPHGMGFLVFLKRGIISLIEGYSYDNSTVPIDFEHVAFEVRPWSVAGNSAI